MLTLEKRHRWRLLATLFVVLIALSLLLPFPEEICSKNEYTNEKECTRYHFVAVALWHFIKILDASSVALTAIATVLLAYITYGLVAGAREQTKTTQVQLRAFVFASGLNEFPETGPNHGEVYWRLRPVWTNSGATPTRGMKLFTDCEIRLSPLPSGFNFDRPAHPAGSGLLGPNYSNMGGAAPIPQQPAISPNDLVDVQRGVKFIYVWGWVRYRDVFPGTEEHITRFCWSVSTIGNPLNCVAGARPNHPRRLTFTFTHHNEGNCADEECG